MGPRRRQRFLRSWPPIHLSEEATKRARPLRRPWREGPRPRGTVARRPRPGHCAGTPRRTGLSPCAERRDRARVCGSPHCCITSLSDGSQRPLAILCLEDKVIQQAVATVLEAIYEEDFVGFSYGFRPGRGQHDALDAVHVGILRKRVNWVLDADIQGFYDAMAHAWIIRFLEHRIADKRILRLIAKWLKVGIIEDGRVTCSQCGAPQGAVISPILANVYLHYVFDLWAHRWPLHKASGDIVVLHYRDA